MRHSAQLLAVFVLAVMVPPASAQMLAGEALVKALRQGGYVIVTRHASSPREVPNKQTADADNVKMERQLDEAGRAGSVAMGRALRDLKIPVGEVLTSPTYRALETVRLALLPNPRAQTELVMAAKACRASQTRRLSGSASASLICPPARTPLS